MRRRPTPPCRRWLRPPGKAPTFARRPPPSRRLACPFCFINCSFRKATRTRHTLHDPTRPTRRPRARRRGSRRMGTTKKPPPGLEPGWMPVRLAGRLLGGSRPAVGLGKSCIGVTGHTREACVSLFVRFVRCAAKQFSHAGGDLLDLMCRRSESRTRAWPVVVNHMYPQTDQVLPGPSLEPSVGGEAGRVAAAANHSTGLPSARFVVDRAVPLPLAAIFALLRLAPPDGWSVVAHVSPPTDRKAKVYKELEL